MNKTAEKTLYLTVGVACGVCVFLAAPANAQGYYQPYYEQAPVTVNSSYKTDSSSSGFFAPTGARILSDPLYLPPKEKIYGSTTYSFTSESFDIYNSAGVNTATNDGDNNRISQTLGYGITDRLSVYLTDTYGFGDSSRENFNSDTTTANKSDGFTNPGISMTYRLVDQKNLNAIAADLHLGYSPDMFDSEIAGGGSNGTIASGRQTATIAVSIGREMKGLTLRGQVGATYNGERNYVTLINNQKVTVDSFIDYSLGLFSQTRITDRFSIDGDIGYVFSQKGKAINNDTDVAWTRGSNSRYNFALALNYHFIPNKLVGQVGYNHYIRNDYKNIYSTSPSSSEVKNNTGDTIQAGLIYTLD